MSDIGPQDALTFALDAVNDRWSLHIVRALAFGASRYTDILRSVGAPRDVLASRLRALSDAKILEKEPVEGKSRAGYRLTAKGTDLAQVILVLKKWGDLYGDEVVPRISFKHTPCGHTFVADIHCHSCGEPLHRGELTVASEHNDSDSRFESAGWPAHSKPRD